MDKHKYTNTSYELTVRHDSDFSPYEALGKRKCERCNRQIAGVSHALYYSWSQNKLTVWCRLKPGQNNISGMEHG